MGATNDRRFSRALGSENRRERRQPLGRRDLAHGNLCGGVRDDALGAALQLLHVSHHGRLRVPHLLGRAEEHHLGAGFMLHGNVTWWRVEGVAGLEDLRDRRSERSARR